MKIVAISDTHGQEVKNLPKADLLIHAGDFSTSGTFQDFNNFMIWMAKIRLNYKKIILTAGNHERWVEKNQAFVKEEFAKLSIDFLIDEETYFEGLKIYGMPWTPFFLQWAYMGSEEKRKLHCEAIPSDTDILVTHGPPKRYLDLLAEGSSDPGTHAGCKFLAEAMHRVKPALMVVGHIHEGSGIQIIDQTLLINASCMDQNYRLVNGFKVIYL